MNTTKDALRSIVSSSISGSSCCTCSSDSDYIKVTEDRLVDIGRAAGVLRDGGKFEEAMKLYERALSGREASWSQSC